MCAPLTHAMGAGSAEHPKLRVADIFRDHAEDYRRHHALSRQQAKALGAIVACRTPALGLGFIDYCPDCGFVRPIYKSCRNRNCPTCQASAQAEWVEKRQERVLPTHHFHVVFTLPAELRPVALRNPTLVFDAMFAAASETLLALGRQRLGGEIGASVVLHTWTRAMLFHPHLHCVVTGGALSDRTWSATLPNFLFPVAVMRKRFSTLVRGHLRKLWPELDLGGECAPFAAEKAFARHLRALRRKDWVVYAKRPFKGPAGLFRYLGQYTHRIAISNHRLREVTQDRIVFQGRGKQRVTVSPQEFIRRFLLHVLPARFHKIRHYGLYSSTHVHGALMRAREALVRSGAAVLYEASPDAENLAAAADARRPCPICGTLLVRTSSAYADILFDTASQGVSDTS